MPHGKKKGGRTNNKKQRRGVAGHGKNTNRNSSARTTGPTSTSENLPLTPGNALKGIAPRYKEFLKNEEALHESYPTMYSRYKAATNRVFLYMKKNSPE